VKFTQRMCASSMTTRVLGVAAGTALLGVGVVGVADGTAGHGRRPQTATLAALSHPRLAPGSAAKAGRPATRSRSELAREQARSGAPGRSAAPAREGRVISTGIKDAGGELVLYGVRIHTQQLPGITFGIMAGLRDSAGGLTPELETNETQGSASSAGFHAVEAASSVGSPAVAVPEFGYYAGPAATITAQEGGRQVRAHLARWSANPASSSSGSPLAAPPAPCRTSPPTTPQASRFRSDKPSRATADQRRLRPPVTAAAGLLGSSRGKGTIVPVCH
jgi:hypothetical protein